MIQATLDELLGAVLQLMGFLLIPFLGGSSGGGRKSALTSGLD